MATEPRPGSIFVGSWRGGTGAWAIARGGCPSPTVGGSGVGAALRRGGGAGGLDTCGGDGGRWGTGGAGGLETAGAAETVGGTGLAATGGIGERDAAGGGGGGGRDGTFTCGGGGVGCAWGTIGPRVLCAGPLLEGGAGGLGGEDAGADAPRTGGSGRFDVFARGGKEAGAFELAEAGAEGFREEGGGGDCDWDPMPTCYQGNSNLLALAGFNARTFLSD